jgi:hypothetical protein
LAGALQHIAVPSPYDDIHTIVAADNEAVVVEVALYIGVVVGDGGEGDDTQVEDYSSEHIAVGAERYSPCCISEDETNLDL